MNNKRPKQEQTRRVLVLLTNLASKNVREGDK